MNSFKYLSTIALSLAMLSCVQQTQPKIITVKVDMNGVETPSKVGLRGGNPLSWDETTYLSDDNNDGIYEGVFEIYTANYNIQFKFVNNDSEFELENQNNRSLTFEYKPENIIYKAIFNNLNDTEITRN